MNTLNRRTVLAVSGIAALAHGVSSARIAGPRTALFSCGAVMIDHTPTAVDSDIPFDKAYIDTTIPYHESALKLVDLNIDDLEDDRLIEVSSAILEEFPQDIEKLLDMRERLYDSRELEEATYEHMLISMGGMESCSDQTHLDFMDPEWLEDAWKDGDDPLIAYVSLLVLLLEMEQHQHMSGEELAADDDLRVFCEELYARLEPQIKLLKEVRGELMTRS